MAAIRNNTPVPENELNALVTLVNWFANTAMPKTKTIQNFIAAGYRKKQVMEPLLGIALKTIGNYLDHLARMSTTHSRRKVNNSLCYGRRSNPPSVSNDGKS